MPDKTVELYTDGDMEKMKGRVKGWVTALFLLGAAALAVCVTLAALTNTLNAAKMELACVLVSTLAGWLVIYFAVFKVIATGRELRHAEMLRTEERERLEGTVTVTRERFRIRKSVPVRRVEIRATDGEPRKILVCESRAKALEEADPGVLYAVHGYAAAYEVTK